MFVFCLRTYKLGVVVFGQNTTANYTSETIFLLIKMCSTDMYCRVVIVSYDS